MRQINKKQRPTIDFHFTIPSAQKPLVEAFIWNLLLNQDHTH